MKRANDDVKVSGAHIRSLVKQLSSSSGNMRSSDPAPQPPQKKQVRRRLQTRKPYQEKLLNMAEARREIVTALKLHRAAMKQQQIIQPDQKSRRNPRIYASSSSWPAPPPPPALLHLALPSQPLGLNLNLHEFITTPPSSSSSIYSASASIGGGFQFLTCRGGEEEREEEIVSSPFDQLMEFPAWVNADETCLQHVHHHDFFQASVLPCMEIEEIEGMDGDWLA